MTVTGSSVSLTLSRDLSPETEYHVACLAESDAGAESTQQQIEVSRRMLFTENQAIFMVF